MPFSTSTALKIVFSNLGRSPVSPSVNRIFSWVPLEATQVAPLIASSAVITPGTASRSRVNASRYQG